MKEYVCGIIFREEEQYFTYMFLLIFQKFTYIPTIQVEKAVKFTYLL